MARSRPPSHPSSPATVVPWSSRSVARRLASTSRVPAGGDRSSATAALIRVSSSHGPPSWTGVESSATPSGAAPQDARLGPMTGRRCGRAVARTTRASANRGRPDAPAAAVQPCSHSGPEVTRPPSERVLRGGPQQGQRAFLAAHWSLATLGLNSSPPRWSERPSNVADLCDPHDGCSTGRIKHSARPSSLEIDKVPDWSVCWQDQIGELGQFRYSRWQATRNPGSPG